MTREEEIALEKEINECLTKEYLYPEYVLVSPWHSFIKIEMEIEGDWKHDHLRTGYVLENTFFPKHKFMKITHTKQEVGQSDSDYYTAIHTWIVRKEDD